MRVIPASTRGPRRKRDLAMATSRDERTALLLRAVRNRRYQLAVPVHQLRNVSVIEDVHGNLLPLFHAQDRAGHLPTIGNRLDSLSARQLNGKRCNANRVV